MSKKDLSINREFKKFCESYSKNVDKADRLAFWRLSDAIIFEILRRNIPHNLNSKNIILDAGGGTGRWAIKLSKIFKCGFIVYDSSEDMLRQAAKNINSAGLRKNIEPVRGDLTDMHKIAAASVDHIISIYNPISFIHKKKEALKEMYRVLKPYGKILIMGQGYFNAFASKINNYLAPPSELKMMQQTKTVKWVSYVPPLNIFSKESLGKELESAGFFLAEAYGIPIFVHPGPEDFDPKNIKKSLISKALEDKKFFSAIFKLEMRYNNLPSAVNRGMNILYVGEKK